jgi:hypothetical protein
MSRAGAARLVRSGTKDGFGIFLAPRIGRLGRDDRKKPGFTNGSP